MKERLLARAGRGLRFKQSSLATQASLNVFILSLFCVIIVTSWQLVALYRDEVKKVNLQIEALESSLVDVVGRSLWIYDEDQLQTILKGVKSLEYVSYATIMENDGLVIKEGVSTADSIRKSRRITAPAMPDEVIGALVIESDLGVLRAKVLKRILYVFGSNFVLIMLISALTILVFQIRVARPLIALSRYAERIQLNSDGLPLAGKVHDKHEIGQVYNALTVMQGNIQKDFQTILQAEAELELYKNELERLVEERTDKLIQTTKNLIDSSRKAGMAEVATGVLHNIGNVLTGANLRVQNLKSLVDEDDSLVHLQALVALLRKQGPALGSFLATSEQGQKVLPFLEAFVENLSDQHEELKESIRLQRLDLSMISHIIAKQQAQAKFSGLVENLLFAECIEDVLSIHSFEINRFGISLERNYLSGLSISTDRHKLLQILSNLVTNAIQATQPNEGARRIRLELTQSSDRILFVIQDNGIGISKEQYPNIFRYGYTTKKEGHGFGLHSSALDAKILGGSLSCTSSGLGLGAVFTLDLPRIFLPRSESDLIDPLIDFKLPEHPES